MGGRQSSGEVVRLSDRIDQPTMDGEPRSRAVTPAIPAKIGRYTVLDLLGVGGMGMVCTAFDPKLDRKVAIKLLRDRVGEEDRHSVGQARLVREAQSLAKLTHPNIVTVHDVDEVDGQIYMAMEYVDGISLDKWMVRAERSWRAVVRVFIQAAQGLAAAHAAGITHRDFKPANVLIGKDGRVLVVDFGLAKSRGDGGHDESTPNAAQLAPAEALRERGFLMEVIGTSQDTKLTQVGRTVGTPAYMAPEQFLGLPVGPYTDQFSFGVALFESLYGRLPFAEEVLERVTEGQVSEPPKDTAVPGWVHRVVLRMLQRRPEARYSSINAVIAALQADPAKRRRRALYGVGGVLLAGMSVWGLAQSLTGEDMCTGAGDQMAQVWNDGRRAEMAAAFEAVSLPYAQDQGERVERALSRRAADWVEHHQQVCRATNVHKEQSSRLMDVRMACLERRRGELRALVEVFLSADEGVVYEAVKAVQSLEGSARCTTQTEGAGFEMVDPEQQRQAEDIDRQLARVQAYDVSGKIERALEVAESALRSARALGHQPTLARAAIPYARLLASRTDDPEAAREQLIEAIWLAEVTEQPQLEVLGWAKLITLEGGALGRPDAGIALQVPAQLALRSLDDPRAEGMLLRAVGSALHKKNDHEAALKVQLKALETLRLAYPRQHSAVASSLSNVGAQYGILGRYDEGRPYLEEAAEMLERLYGPRHPTLGSAHLNLGELLRLDTDDAEEARKHFEAALEIFEAALPDDHPRVVKAKLGLVHVERILDPPRAEARYIALLDEQRGRANPDLRMIASLQSNLGDLRRTLANSLAAGGDEEAAARKFEQAHEDFTAVVRALEQQGDAEARPQERVRGFLDLCLLERDRGNVQAALERCRTTWQDGRAIDPVGPDAIEALGVWAQLLVQQGRSDDAVAALREGVEASPLPLSSESRLQLAELLWASASRRDEAVRLVRAVEEALESGSEERQAVEQWLREHSL